MLTVSKDTMLKAGSDDFAAEIRESNSTTNLSHLLNGCKSRRSIHTYAFRIIRTMFSVKPVIEIEKNQNGQILYYLLR